MKAWACIEVLLNATMRQDEHWKIFEVVAFGQDITGHITQEREYAKLIDTANGPLVWSRCCRKSECMEQVGKI
jgi:hypothetical protein